MFYNYTKAERFKFLTVSTGDFNFNQLLGWGNEDNGKNTKLKTQD